MDLSLFLHFLLRPNLQFNNPCQCKHGRSIVDLSSIRDESHNAQWASNLLQRVDSSSVMRPLDLCISQWKFIAHTNLITRFGPHFFGVVEFVRIVSWNILWLSIMDKDCFFRPFLVRFNLSSGLCYLVWCLMTYVTIQARQLQTLFFQSSKELELY